MRVLFVVPDLAVGGAERHLVSLVTTMDRARCVPSVVCLGEPGELFAEVAAAGVSCRALRRRKRDAARTLVDLWRLLRRERPDVVVVRGYSADALGRIAALLLGVPTMVWVHHSAELVRRTVVRRAVERVLNPRSAAVLGLVEAQRPYLAGLGWRADQVVIVPPGVTPPPVTGSRAPVRAALGIAPEAEVAVAVARLAPEKDHATLLRAFAHVRAERPAARLLLVGDGSLRADLERLAATLGVSDAVVFAGRRGDVGDLLAAADVAVLSSVSECAPVAVLEAMAAGVPVVATAVGGVPELVDDGRTGVLVLPSDPAALAAALRALLADPDRRAALGGAARARVDERFRWTTLVGKVEDALLAGARAGDASSLASDARKATSSGAGAGDASSLTSSAGDASSLTSSAGGASSLSLGERKSARSGRAS